ncbi:UDP-glucose 4-epimerase GalE [Pseudomonas sp. TUM22785]|uniref:UDP-glucose 4-epimerase GalE n=1 Tax=Pseudomonas sp. TUM22785 TaxID=3019098 RepID=UPI0023055F4F|nr:UDP-glucose 4-epimerase GalE [Pseudomonas sp. TUM22785]WCD82153.1 UDP-glucose 4-epimerase GalE [Pseudomonas sp. TUM22785]
MSVLVAGGAGYIGSHVILELLETGHDVVAIDNLSNSSFEAVSRIEKLTNSRVKFVEGDIRDKAVLDDVFTKHSIDSVVLLAGLKSVSESLHNPLNYYSNNVGGAISLLQAMERHGVFSVIFSSSATVYGKATSVPILESSPTGLPCSPYGYSKLVIESLLQDLASSSPAWSIAVLRYFNPIGAHASGIIGEDPHGIPNNLVPYISQVAVGKLKELSVFGGDYPTVDGTGVRDYIHVVDLAKGHLAALEYIRSRQGIYTWNLGTGVGYSVLQVIAAFESASGVSVPYKIISRRPGDIAECWSSPAKALLELNWKAKFELQQMMEDTWRWQTMNPNGYR